MYLIFNCFKIFCLLFIYQKIEYPIIDVYFNNLRFQNNIWNFFELFNTALILASQNGHTEIVKILVEQKGIDINAKNIVYFNNLVLQNNVWYFFKLFRTELIYTSENGKTEIVCSCLF